MRFNYLYPPAKIRHLAVLSVKRLSKNANITRAIIKYVIYQYIPDIALPPQSIWMTELNE